jgi:hypothetical protein
VWSNEKMVISKAKVGENAALVIFLPTQITGDNWD